MAFNQSIKVVAFDVCANVGSSSCLKYMQNLVTEGLLREPLSLSRSLAWAYVYTTVVIQIEVMLCKWKVNQGFEIIYTILYICFYCCIVWIRLIDNWTLLYKFKFTTSARCGIRIKVRPQKITLTIILFMEIFRRAILLLVTCTKKKHFYLFFGTFHIVHTRIILMFLEEWPGFQIPFVLLFLISHIRILSFLICSTRSFNYSLIYYLSYKPLLWIIKNNYYKEKKSPNYKIQVKLV